MKNEKYNDKLLEITKKHKFNVTKILKRPENKYLVDYINVWYDFPPETKTSVKIFWILNDIHQRPICENHDCNNEIPINNINLKTGEYCHFCSSKCAASSEQRKEKTRKTCIQRYGSNAPAGNKEIQCKIQQTNLERYGVSCTWQADIVKEQIRQTNLERYGVEYPTQNPEIIKKTQNTCIEKYGVPNGGGSTQALNKIQQTNLERYGVSCTWQADIVKEQIRQTNLERYGTEYFLQTGIAQEASSRQRSEKSYIEFIASNPFDQPCFTLEEYISRLNAQQKLEFKCNKCGNHFFAAHQNGKHSRCPKCYPTIQVGISGEEKDLVQQISAFYQGKIIQNTKSLIQPQEIDIYFPNNNIAIEFDGIYWHSVDSNDDVSKEYHLHKTEACLQKRIQLIHVFENEWIFKKDVVLSRIKNLLGVHDNVVFARKCFVKEVSSDVSGIFQEENHIQGNVKSKINLGLFYDNELISLMTFGKPRFNKKYEWELLRFCNKLGYHIPGAAGKLLKYFERNYHPKSLISYADRRWSQGKLYEAIGFQLDHISQPNYWYFNPKTGILNSRINFQKHKLKNILEKFDESKTEVENMKDNGYYRIFDCGNLVYVKEYDESK